MQCPKINKLNILQLISTAHITNQYKLYLETDQSFASLKIDAKLVSTYIVFISHL